MRGNTLQSRLFQDGAMFEEEVLGRCTVKFSGYMAREQAMREVRKHQPARKTPAIVAIEREFEKRLGEKVTFHTAVGSSLDVYHGVDGFFEFRGVVVTIDTTLNPEKQTAKADLIFGEEIHNASLAAVRLAREFARKLERR